MQVYKQLNKSYYFPLLFLFITFINNNECIAFNNNKICYIEADSNDLKISYKSFKDKMHHYIDLMREEADFTEEEYIEMILIDNTNTNFLFSSALNPYYKVHTHNEFLDLLKGYMDDIIETLEAKDQGCNGGFYSSKHDLCIGGTDPNKQSLYEVYEYQRL